MERIAELMRHQPSKPRTHCSLNAICSFCPERRYCPAYCKPKRWKIVTLDEGIRIAKNNVDNDESIFPARSTISGWIQKGIIRPMKRENLGRGGGAKDIFSDDLPIEIDLIFLFQKGLHQPLNRVAKIKSLAEEFIKQTEFTFSELMTKTDLVNALRAATYTHKGDITPEREEKFNKIVPTIDLLHDLYHYRDIWLNYYFKMKAGRKILEHTQISFKFQYNPENDKFTYTSSFIELGKENSFNFGESLKEYHKRHSKNELYEQGSIISEILENRRKDL